MKTATAVALLSFFYYDDFPTSKILHLQEEMLANVFIYCQFPQAADFWNVVWFDLGEWLSKKTNKLEASRFRKKQQHRLWNKHITVF